MRFLLGVQTRIQGARISADADPVAQLVPKPKGYPRFLHPRLYAFQLYLMYNQKNRRLTACQQRRKGKFHE